MSADAINPAPPPASGPAGPGGASAIAPGQHGHAALTGFQILLESLSGDQSAASDAATAAAAAGPKPAVGGKSATDGGKSQTSGKAANGKAGDDKMADADGAATALDPSLVVPVPVLPAVPIQTVIANAAGEAAATQAGRTAKSVLTDATTTQTAAGALAQAGAAKTADDAGQAKTASAAELAASATAAATDASAKAPTAAPKVDVAPSPAPVAPLSATPPAPTPVATQPQIPAQAQTLDAAATAAALQPPPADPKALAQDAAKPAPAKGSRVDITKAAATPGAPSTVAITATAAGSSAKAADALQPLTGQASKAALDDATAEPAADAHTQAGGEAAAQTPADPATSATTTPATLIHAAAVAVRGAPQTVANLAAQIVKKLDGRSSQFNVQLDPAGLGKVDVRIAIGADGRMSAAMSFDTPQAAAELKSRSVELQQAMEQAGFDLSGGMSFDVASDSGQGGQAQHQQADAGAAFRGRAFQAALDTTADAAPPPQLALRRTALAGVDIRI